MKPVGDTIRKARTRFGWTLVRLSAETGIPYPNLSRIETGQRIPKLPTLKKIATALGTTVAALCRGI